MSVQADRSCNRCLTRAPSGGIRTVNEVTDLLLARCCGLRASRPSLARPGANERRARRWIHLDLAFWQGAFVGCTVRMVCIQMPDRSTRCRSAQHCEFCENHDTSAGQEAMDRKWIMERAEPLIMVVRVGLIRYHYVDTHTT